MTANDRSCPLPRSKLIERYFLEHRAKLLDVAAFLDRLDRAAPDDAPGRDDFRVAALRRAIAILADARPQRAKRILDLLSDPSAEPIASAKGMKGAYGAHPG